MTLLQISREALRTVRKHTIGFTSVQTKVLEATENEPLDGAPFVGLNQKLEIAQLSLDDGAFDEIVAVLKQRLMGTKWRRVVKALMILHYCLQEGSGRFIVWCKMNSALLTSLETYRYISEDETLRDYGREVRREALKISALLHDPTFLDMRSHVEVEHIARRASMYRQENVEQLQKPSKTSLRRRGALIGFRRLDRSDVTAASGSSSNSNRTLVDSTPITVKQKVKTAISDNVDTDSALHNIKDIARQTTCPADFLDIMEAILESLVSDNNNRDWGQVLRAIVLLRQCLSNVSSDVAAYFKGNDEVMHLLYGSRDIGDIDLLGRTANAFRNSLSSANEKEALDNPELPPLPPRTTRVEVPEKQVPLDPPAYTILNPDDETPDDTYPQDDKHELRYRRANDQQQLSPSSRPLPSPPASVDWSRLYTAAAGQTTPAILLPEKDLSSQLWRMNRSSASLVSTGPSRPLPPPPASPLVIAEASEASEEVPPSYAAATAPISTDSSSFSVVSSPVTTLVDLESDDDIEYVDEVVDTSSEPALESPTLNTEIEPRTAEEVLIDVTNQGEAINGATSVELPSQDLHDVVPLPPSYLDEDVAAGLPSGSARPSISITVSPPSRAPTTFDSPDAISSSDSSSPPSSSLVRCLTGLVRRGPEPACARGGYSDVWKGKLISRLDPKDEEDVAIKVLRAVRVQSGACPISRMHKRMMRETSIWGKLDHRNIVPLRGYSLDEDGTPAIISRWMDNGDVLTYLAKHLFADRRKLVRQVAEGLLYLHSQSPPVVHGDLKGGNVLIDKEGDAALCDFGMSTFLMDYQTMSSTSNAAVGTLRWCAPELLASDVPLRTLATDIWAFASLSLEILTGRLPFYNCTNDVKVIQNIALGKTPAREDYPELPMDNRFWEVLEACWKQDPEERPTMEQLRPLIFDDEMFSALTP